MAKTPKKLVNFRLPLTTVEFITEAAGVMGLSQSEVVEQAVTLFESMQTDAPVKDREPPDTNGDKPTRDELQAMVTEKQGKETVASDLPKNARCKHCGSAFAGVTGAITCPRCIVSGHGGGTNNCRVCTEGTAL